MTESLAAWIELPQFLDDRGCLGVLDFCQLPFVPRRLFYVKNVPTGSRRGGHAHRHETQILVCLAGHIDVELRRGRERCTVACVPGGRGLIVAPRVWAQETYVEPGSTLLVVCSHPYDASAYITDPEAVAQ